MSYDLKTYMIHSLYFLTIVYLMFSANYDFMGKSHFDTVINNTIIEIMEGNYYWKTIVMLKV